MPVPPAESPIEIPLTDKGHPVPTIGGVSDVRRCVLCGELRSPEEMHTAHGSTNYCRHCEQPLATRTRKRSEEQKKQARKGFLALLRKRNVAESRLELICDEITDLFGGTAPLAKAYFDELKEWQEKHPGSLATLKVFDSLFRLMGHCDRQKVDAAMDVAGLTDDELDTMIAHLAREVLEESMDAIDVESIDEEPP